MSDDLWLTKEQLARLTGYRQKARQIAKLKADRIPHTVSRTGHPVVARAAIEGAGGIEKVRRKRKEQTEPNWAAIGL
ncbi:DUF4224 domain-containing protein [Aquabacterium olei]|uniref:DUF4224 domain-containing protein n=1 Tax=Aquabacterium olei TaxID=1296669 RepID=UPI00131EDC4B|nr:DUF4224 domain-containing protein [Aquabacterium olei]